VISLIANRVGGPRAWELLTARWDEITTMMPAKAQSYLVAAIPTFIADPEFANRVAAFHLANPVASGQRSVEQDVERMLMGAAFAERVRPQLGSLHHS